MATVTISYTANEGGSPDVIFTGCNLMDNANNVYTIGDKFNIHQGKKVAKISFFPQVFAYFSVT